MQAILVINGTGKSINLSLITYLWFHFR